MSAQFASFTLGPDGFFTHRVTTRQFRIKTHPFEKGKYRLAYHLQDTVTQQKLVAKHSLRIMAPDEELIEMLADLHSQSRCKLLALQYTKKLSEIGFRRNMDFLEVSLIRFENGETYAVETWLDTSKQKWIKYTTSTKREVAEAAYPTVLAFGHFCHHFSGDDQLVPADLQVCLYSVVGRSEFECERMNCLMFL